MVVDDDEEAAVHERPSGSAKSAAQIIRSLSRDAQVLGPGGGGGGVGGGGGGAGGVGGGRSGGGIVCNTLALQPQLLEHANAEAAGVEEGGKKNTRTRSVAGAQAAGVNEDVEEDFAPSATRAKRRAVLAPNA